MTADFLESCDFRIARKNRTSRWVGCEIDGNAWWTIGKKWIQEK